MPSYSDPERQDLRERFPQQSPRRAAVKISVNELRMKFSVGSVESQPAGIPLLRVMPPNTGCFIRESRAAGCALFPKRTLRCGVGIPRLYYKGFAGAKSACAIRD